GDGDEQAVVKLSEKDGYLGAATLTINNGTKFKLRSGNNWIGINDLLGSSASYIFTTADTDNLYCNYTGKYEVRLTTSQKLEIYYVPTAGASEDCFVLGLRGGYTNAHVYAPGPVDVYAWKDSKAFNGDTREYITGIRHTYDVWFSGGDYDGYHIFRIEADMHKDFNVILRDMGASMQSSTIPASSADALYIDKNTAGIGDGAPAAEVKSKSSAEYAVAKLVYDIGAVRGTNSYKGRSFAYTICNVTQEQAVALVDRYDTLMADDDAKELLDCVMMNTYSQAEVEKDSDVDEGAKSNYNLSQIVESLRTIASHKETKAFDILPTQSSRDISVTVSVAAIASVLAVGVFLVIKRKKA
ncbi:MAG: hypothetical protein J6O18_06570, partial [Bacilli bacterium]|nr:hypothetical protein [Bacilli bacterium]